jgi:hypothetical protein
MGWTHRRTLAMLEQTKGEIVEEIFNLIRSDGITIGNQVITEEDGALTVREVDNVKG